MSSCFCEVPQHPPHGHHSTYVTVYVFLHWKYHIGPPFYGIQVICFCWFYRIISVGCMRNNYLTKSPNYKQIFLSSQNFSFWCLMKSNIVKTWLLYQSFPTRGKLNLRLTLIKNTNNFEKGITYWYEKTTVKD